MRYVRLAPLLLLWAAGAYGESFDIDKSASVFAVVIHKAGVAAAMAHNHFIYAGEYEASLTAEGNKIETGRFQIDFPVTGLVADDPEAKSRWYPRIEALGILKEPFEKVEEKDREKIRETMLSDVQLDAEKYPRMSAKVTGIEAGSKEKGDYTHTIALSFTAHGKTVEHKIPARIELTGDTLKVEATGRFSFTEFGIKPYSAMMGAVKNKDEFDVYVNLTAKAKS